jgi:tryptophan synthase alpha chain
MMTENLRYNRVNKRFQELSKRNECGLICYIVGGYPDIPTTEEIAYTLINSGADIIEIGIPYSDPIADGPIIQEASYQSLSKGVTPDLCLRISKNIRKRFPDTPIVAMTYSNIVMRRGLREFMLKSKNAGIDGFILPDMAVEEADYYAKEAENSGLATIFLASPDTTSSRLEYIMSKCSGFIYMVSVYGVTGVRESFEGYTSDAIKNIKRIVGSRLPVAVGFGISNPSQVKFMIHGGADAVIVGSAIIKKIKDVENKKKMLQELSSFVRELKKACL